MKKIKFLAAAVLLLTVYSCKKTGMDVYVGSWYVKSEKLEFLALDSVSEKLYENSYLFKFEREGVYHILHLSILPIMNLDVYIFSRPSLLIMLNCCV